MEKVRSLEDFTDTDAPGDRIIVGRTLDNGAYVVSSGARDNHIFACVDNIWFEIEYPARALYRKMRDIYRPVPKGDTRVLTYKQMDILTKDGYAALARQRMGTK